MPKIQHSNIHCTQKTQVYKKSLENGLQGRVTDFFVILIFCIIHPHMRKIENYNFIRRFCVAIRAESRINYLMLSWRLLFTKTGSRGNSKKKYFTIYQCFHFPHKCTSFFILYGKILYRFHDFEKSRTQKFRTDFRKFHQKFPKTRS